VSELISVIGGGLAGSEAALQLARRGFKIQLLEMRPNTNTEAHQTDYFAELVCSNSLKSIRLDTGAGLLKAEMQLFDSILLNIAEACRVPAGHALAVDRSLFAQKVSEHIYQHPNIQIVRKEAQSFPAGKVVLATGPLTSKSMMHYLQNTLGEKQLFFFDAIAPIIDADTIDRNLVYAKARYDKGDADYLNCAFTKEEYYAFVEALLLAEKHEAHEFENEFFAGDKFSFYENCMPIEELAQRGKDTLRHGVMRPMGLEIPATGKKAFAVLQLRAENKDLTAYNLVGCQTMLRYSEQKKVFRMIPGLADATFLRFGSIHQNTYLNSPAILNQNLSLQANPDVWIAGQLSGVEGYVECIASGLLIAKIISLELHELPEETMLGQLWRRLLQAPLKGAFSPVNANFGILPGLSSEIRDKKLKKEMLSQRSLATLKAALSYNNV
jgi:methylenetetrahydrofolate--tRNA-(uracil-5-)-methyltransferase